MRTNQKKIKWVFYSWKTRVEIKNSIHGYSRGLNIAERELENWAMGQ